MDGKEYLDAAYNELPYDKDGNDRIKGIPKMACTNRPEAYCQENRPCL